MINPHLHLNDSFVPAIGDLTEKAIDNVGKGAKPARKVFDYLWAQWHMKFNKTESIFGISPKTEKMAKDLGYGMSSVEKALNVLEKLGVYIRIPYYFYDGRRKDRTDGDRRRWSIPIALGQSTREEVLRECRAKAASPDAMDSSKVLKIIDSLLMEYDEASANKAPSELCAASYRNAHTLSQDDLELAEGSLRVREKPNLLDAIMDRCKGDTLAIIRANDTATIISMDGLPARKPDTGALKLYLVQTDTE